MNLNDVKNLDKNYYMNTFGERIPVCFQNGNGINLFDENGKKYYDFLAGIAVNSLGHSHPALVFAIKEQAEKLIHTSSLYYIENQARLAEKLVLLSDFDKAFFCNSGAEANEGAIKLAKMYFYKKKIDKTEIITLINSFHGRTLTTVAATGQEKYQKPYKPLTPGFSHIPINDIEKLKNSVTSKTAAIILELIQGESGVNPLSQEYVNEVCKICKENNILLIIDEIQTGIGRCGSMFAYQNYNIKPDIITLAKGLGGGVPIGCLLATNDVANAFEPGDHGTTFGGNPLATGAALAVLNTIEKENLIENAKVVGEYFKDKLISLKQKHKIIKEVRGTALMLGIEFEEDIAKDIYNKLFEDGFLVGCIGTKILRFLPPLIVKKDDIDMLINVIDKLLKGA